MSLDTSNEEQSTFELQVKQMLKRIESFKKLFSEKKFEEALEIGKNIHVDLEKDSRMGERFSIRPEMKMAQLHKDRQIARSQLELMAKAAQEKDVDIVKANWIELQTIAQRYSPTTPFGKELGKPIRKYQKWITVYEQKAKKKQDPAVKKKIPKQQKKQTPVLSKIQPNPGKNKEKQIEQKTFPENESQNVNQPFEWVENAIAIGIFCSGIGEILSYVLQQVMLFWISLGISGGLLLFYIIFRWKIKRNKSPKEAGHTEGVPLVPNDLNEDPTLEDEEMEKQYHTYFEEEALGSETASKEEFGNQSLVEYLLKTPVGGKI